MPFLNMWGDGPINACGLVYLLEGFDDMTVPVPLKKVSVSAKVVDFVSEVTVKQEYVNRESSPIEAVYNFPVEEESAVTDFEARVDGRTVSCSYFASNLKHITRH